MEFKKYMHIEKFGNEEVDGIENGECYIFPKIDGTNGQVYINNGIIMAGSRNRELTLDKDNGGFLRYVLENNAIKKFMNAHRKHRLYGEFLIPHTLKTYREDAWRKFYVFDVATVNENGTEGLVPYDEYSSLLDAYNIEYITPIMKTNYVNLEMLVSSLDKNTFLIKDGKGIGEGVIVKNYDFVNKYGRQTWAKLVANEFKEKHSKNSKVNILSIDGYELKFVEECCTESLIEKEYSKIKNETGFNQKDIPRLLNTVYYVLINEELWNFIKKNRNPKIDFKMVNSLVIKKIKEVKSDLF